MYAAESSFISISQIEVAQISIIIIKSRPNECDG